jgi:hypothetical protein
MGMLPSHTCILDRTKQHRCLQQPCTYPCFQQHAEVFFTFNPKTMLKSVSLAILFGKHGEIPPFYLLKLD